MGQTKQEQRSGQGGAASRELDSASRDRVDEASKQSFPASDPPAHWAGKDEPPTLNGEPLSDESDASDEG